MNIQIIDDDTDPHAILYLDDLRQQCPVYFDKNIGNIGFFSEEIVKICRKLEKLGQYPDLPVLIEGRTGTGKEIFARYLHYTSPRAKGEFVALNCSAISKELFEAELFGYTGGAFTGADPRGKTGKLSLAAGGTLFLDEITEIPLSHQSKLLRVLQEREYYPVGGSIKQTITTGIVCAANRQLAGLVRQNLFREDLFYRLNACRIHIPPLRKRKAEILPLAVLFLQDLNKKKSSPIKGMEAGFIKKLYAYHWPGNIRELKNLLTKLSLFNESEILRSDSLDLPAGTPHNPQPVLDIEKFSLPEKNLDLEKLIANIISRTLEKFDGNKTRTAAYLQIPRKKLYHRYHR